MRSHVFLTPMSPDGTPGEVKEIQFSDPGQQMFAAFVPYFATQDATTRSSLEVQKEIDAVAAELPKLKGGRRSKADHQLRLLERELRLARDREETERRNNEREQERKRQQPTGNVQQAVASAVAAVQAVVGSKTKQVQNKLTWQSLRADLDARTPASVSAANRAAGRCCEGKYLCSKCQARKAAAVA